MFSHRRFSDVFSEVSLSIARKPTKCCITSGLKRTSQRATGDGACRADVVAASGGALVLVRAFIRSYSHSIIVSECSRSSMIRCSKNKLIITATCGAVVSILANRWKNPSNMMFQPRSLHERNLLCIKRSTSWRKRSSSPRRERQRMLTERVVHTPDLVSDSCVSGERVQERTTSVVEPFLHVK